MAKQKHNRWLVALAIVAILFVLASVFSAGIGLLMGGFGGISSGNVAHISIDGVLLVDGGRDLFGSSYSSSDEIMRQIDEAEAMPGIRAFIFDINSPGGSGVASYELEQRIERLNVTTIAVIRDIGTSAAYWVASSTDIIYANPLSFTGSIGVFGSYLDFSGLLTRYNVSYERLVAGEFKDMGSPFRELSKTEREMMQQKMDIMHELFMVHVAENRGLEIEQVRKLADGSVLLGLEAHEAGLVDELGTMHDALAFLEEELDEEVILAEFAEEPGLLELLGSLASRRSFSLRDTAQTQMFR